MLTVSTFLPMSNPLSGTGVPRKLTEKQLDTLVVFGIESELEREAVGRQAVLLRFPSGVRAIRSARSTLYTLVQRGYLENITNRRGRSAYRLTLKGKEFLDV